MAERKIGIDAIVNKLDPRRLTEKRVDYVFGGRILKKKRPTRPGQTYSWKT